MITIAAMIPITTLTLSVSGARVKFIVLSLITVHAVLHVIQVKSLQTTHCGHYIDSSIIIHINYIYM